MTTSRRILGIDPGLHTTGYGVIEINPSASEYKPILCEAGIIRSDEKKSAVMAERLLAIHTGMVEVIEQFHPEVVAVEQLYAHYKHPRTAILMGHARGVIFLTAGQRQLPVVSYNATRIKKVVTGSGRASKEQMQYTIQRELGLKTLPEPPDVADALAAALCHCHMERNRYS